LSASRYTTRIPHLIDDDSGIGTQFEVIDSKGVQVFLQQRKK